MRRREFLRDLARYSALCAGVPGIWRVTNRPLIQDTPFTLGVGSGDPTPTGAVIWTRLAPRPLEPGGGMLGQRAGIGWEVADDEQFSKIVHSGRATAAPELGHSIHIDVPGLLPDRWYFYRFTLVQGASPVGQLRTTPADGATTPLRLAFASCQDYEAGYYTAYDHMAREELDLVAHLGDYIYEYSGRPGRVRQYATEEVRTLDQYRIRYAQIKSDPMLQRAHARAPWVVTWDDHEVDNNYAGLNGENNMESEEQMHGRRAAAYQAWWENQPVRVPRARSWADLQITRNLDWGSLAKFWVMDTRQYRSDQACGEGLRQVPCGDWADTTRTILGPSQERWLHAGLSASAARWQVLAQQVVIAPYDQTPGPPVGWWMDSWTGYPASLDRLLRTIAQQAANRTIVLTGDIHSNWVHELPARSDRPDAPIVGAEFVGTSISSAGDGSDANSMWSDSIRIANPRARWHTARRGYVTCEVSANEWKTNYRMVPYVTRPDAPVSTASQWLVQHGKPGIQRI